MHRTQQPQPPQWTVSQRLAWRPAATHIFFIVHRFILGFFLLFQNLRYVWDHGYTQSLQKSLRQVVDDVVRGRTARLHRVPTVGHEASSGHALPRSRRSSAGDEMRDWDRHPGSRYTNPSDHFGCIESWQKHFNRQHFSIFLLMWNNIYCKIKYLLPLLNRCTPTI